ncbi:MAG: acyl-CoA dehydratase activase [Firmicutes bacterium]|nr:acyl-CoA dehydratase activase [Bacillota bacterium]
MNFLGIDIGSVSFKSALLDKKGEILYSRYVRHKGETLRTALDELKKFFSIHPAAEIHNICITGSGGKILAGVMEVPFVNEIVAQSKAVELLYPSVKTIIEIGGEDSKLLLLEKDASGKIAISDFAMNTICAAGTGSFLDQQANRLGLSIEDEFGELAMKSENPPRIAGRCSVFAKSDMIHLQQKAAPDYDIVAGLCFAMARNFVSNIAKGKKFVPPVAFHGGVAANKGMVRAFREILGINDKELIVTEYHGLTGAIGAAILAGENPSKTFSLDLKKIEEFIENYKEERLSLEPLKFHDSRCSYGGGETLKEGEKIEAYLGVDVGSISTNVVVLDKNKNVLSKRYLMTAGRPIEAVRRGLSEVGEEVGNLVEIKGVCTTGSGRYLTGDFIGADIVKNEITAQARASTVIDPQVDTIFEIGGQDSKYISLENGAIVDFEMNKVCAAGTGSFIEEQAEKLSINIKGEFGNKALQSKCPVRLGERCTVFMESDLVYHQQKGADKDDLVAGLGYSIVYNYLNRVVQDKKVGNNIFFQGGVAANKGVVAAFEKVTGKKITVPEHHEVTGAIGCALIAMEFMNGKNKKSTFKGFDLSKKQYKQSSFECKGCSNLCEINRVDVEGEKPLFYGGRCEKYERKKSSEADKIPDLFTEREKILLGDYDEIKALESKKKKIGIPRVLHFYEYFPYWRAFFKELDIPVVLSDPTNKNIINDGVELVLAESCFPIKITHGHITNLLKKEVDYIFLPSIINLKKPDPRFKESVPCPYVQSIPYTIKAAIDIESKGKKVLQPVVDFNRKKSQLIKTLSPMAKEFGKSKAQISKAIDAAQEAQDNFCETLKKRGQEVLRNLKEEDQGIVIVSRPYNGCDSGINLELPKKLRELGAMPIPLDFLPLDDVDLAGEWPHLTWRYGQKIIASSEIIRKDKRLNAIYITNFGCGPDSFLLKFFRTKMGGKVFLQIEIDEHNADAGIITRCEAFLDSIENIRKREPASHKFNFISICKGEKRTIYIPYMCDHAFAIKAAFLANGVDAEVVPESDEETLLWGRKFTSGKECFPAIITTGDMVKITRRPGFDSKKTAFFMPTAGGGCRFGYYNVLQRLVLDELGYKDVPIFAPNQNDTLYSDLGMVGSSFARLAWQGIVCTDIIDKALREVRPYETGKGETEKIYKKYLDKIYDAMIKGKNLQSVMKEARIAFENIPVDRSAEKPVIGVVGEIFVRMHKFSNNHIVENLEKLGAEVWVAPFTEWILYLNYLRKGDSILDGNYRQLLVTHIEDFVQKKDEHTMMHPFEGFLRSNHEPSTEENIAYGKPYLDPTFKGEAILSFGTAADLVKKGASGIVNVMPFTCMPGTIVSGILKSFKEDYDNIPCLNMAYDGLEQTGANLRLEAFVHQCRQYMMSRKQTGSPKVNY